MRELIRTSEGTITRAEFRTGAKMLALLSVIVGGLLVSIRWLSHEMEWMTVAVAPFFGVVVVFAVCSLVYFWYCIFAKRIRALERSAILIKVWLGALFLAIAFSLMDYQNKTLALADTGILAYSGFFALVFAFLCLILFALLLWTGWTGAAAGETLDRTL